MYQQEVRTSQGNRLFYILVGGLLLFSLVCRASMTVNRGLGPDEFHFLHNAWMTAQGATIYKDYWENHTPLLCYLLAPVLKLCGEGTTAILVCRAILSASALGVLLLTFLLARKLYRGDTRVALLAVVVLSYMAIFVQRSIEVRPDQLLVIFWLLSLLLYLKAASRRSGWMFFAAGFLLGIGWLLSPKALLAGAALAATAGLQWYRKRRDYAFRRFLADHLLFLAGFLIPVGGCLLFLHQLGALKPFFTFTIAGNFSNPDMRRPFYLLRIKHLCFFLLAIAGMIYARKEYRRRQPSDDEMILITVTLLLMGLYLFVMPAPYPQSSLLFAPVLAAYSARLLDGSLTGAGRSMRRFIPAALAWTAGLVVPFAALLWDAPFAITNTDQFSRIRFVLNFTAPDDRIFDAESTYIFRPQAYYFSSLFAATRQRIAEGTITRKIPAALAGRRCKMVIRDEWISLLPLQDLTFLRTNYVPTIEPDVYVAGKRFVPADFKSNKVVFDLNIPGVYGLRIRGGSNLQRIALDGQPFPKSRFLRAGTHLLAVRGSFESVTLQVLLGPGRQSQRR